MPNILEPDQYVNTGRRSFFVTSIYAAWAAITGALGLTAAVYLLLPPKPAEKEDWVPAGNLTEIPAETPTEINFRRNRADGWRIVSEQDAAWVVKTPAGSLTAFGPQCTHLGCAYHWEERRHQFVCPCHNSVFAIDGSVVSGPAPRPLDRYETRVRGTSLEIGRLLRSNGEQA
jgi:menaquinol-cytochrome c reductase iron-sulfur subunit